MRIVVIGGSGHIGTFLIPRLVRAGHDLINISRGQRASYVDDPIWDQVRHVTADRVAEDRAGTFPDGVAALQPDVVIDLICFPSTPLPSSSSGFVVRLANCSTAARSGDSVPA